MDEPRNQQVCLDLIEDYRSEERRRNNELAKRDAADADAKRLDAQLTALEGELGMIPPTPAVPPAWPGGAPGNTTSVRIAIGEAVSDIGLERRRSELRRSIRDARSQMALAERERAEAFRESERLLASMNRLQVQFGREGCRGVLA